MPIPAILGGKALEMGFGLIDDLFTSDEEKAEAKQKLIALQQNGDLKRLDAAVSVIVAEANSESWITRSWRPIIMLMFATIIANNYLLYPYLSLFWKSAPVLALPPDLWDLMKLGIGGYVMTRGATQTATAWKGATK